MRKYFLSGLILLIMVLGTYSLVMHDAFAHRSGCHRWHSCPSDTGSYTCGDTGYCSQCPDNNYCKAGQPISLSSSGYSSNSDVSSSSSSTMSTSNPSTTPSIPAAVSTVPEISPKIPSWIKNNAKFWSDGTINDSDFVKGIQYLIEQKIMKVPSVSSGKLQNSTHIPTWVKNTAKWWSEDQIGDSEFIQGIQYLVQNGIMPVSVVQKGNDAENIGLQSIPTGSDTYSIPTLCNAVNGVEPDPQCTPGAIDPIVKQDNIGSTICVPGYTKTVRPSVSYTEPLKFKLMKSYGLTDSPGNYELDHLVPLELGGSPDSIKNLWPESNYANPSSFDKDGLENYLHDQVCSGQLDLKTAQDEIALDWVKYWNQNGRP